MKRTAYLLLLTLIALLPATAKQRENKVLVDSAVCITAHELMRTPDNQVYFNLDIRLSEDFRMSSNRKTHLVPIFTSADNSQEKTFAPIVIYGRYQELMKDDEHLYVYERLYRSQKLLVVCSFTNELVRFELPEDYPLDRGKLVLSNYEHNFIIANGFTTRPYELRVYMFEDEEK